MEINELEKEIISIFERKDWLKETETELICHLVEEVWEVCNSIREKDKANLKKEIADVFFMLVKLCRYYDFNIEDAILTKMGEFKW